MDFLLRNQPVTILNAVVPTSAVAKYAGVQNHGHLTLLITVVNTTGITPSSISLLQSNEAGDNPKAISFDHAFRNLDTDAGSKFEEFPVTGDTFNIDATVSKKLMYVVDVPTDILDKNGDFTHVSVFVGDGTELVSVVGILTEARFSHIGIKD